ncbi:phosphotransferase [Actinokineospora sp.]|uniref:phosphotransferase n=1 Tax=Actinokineospora sp. TaxID=1872133 RepID=UPI0040379FD4
MTGLREGAGPWRLRFAGGEAVLRTGAGAADRARFETEAAALTVGAEHGLPMPRLLGVDLDGPMLLATALPGHSRVTGPPSAERMRALGAAVARLHTVVGQARDGLPVRARSIEDEDFRAAGRSPTQAAADDLLSRVDVPAAPVVLVHGDLWQGNALWDGDDFVGFVDWDCAGVGPAGVDLGSARCDAATSIGQAAADDLLAGWEREAGRSADDVAYWDVVAALSTPADLGDWLSVMHDQGRTDLDGPTMTARRDDFLGAAMDRLG